MKIESNQNQSAKQPSLLSKGAEAPDLGVLAKRGHGEGEKDHLGSLSLARNFPKDLLWLDGPNRRTAEKKFQEARALSLPYVIARQKIGASTFYADGSTAHRYCDAVSGPSKLYTNQGQSWDAGPSKTEFFYILPERGDMVRIGTAAELLLKGFDAGDLRDVLGINGFGYQKIEELRLLEEECLRMARASFHLLTNTGDILSRDPEAAQLVLAPLEQRHREEAMADIIAISAGHRNPIFLKAALKLNYDVARKSCMVDSTPLEHAENKGATEAIALLRALPSM